MEVIRAAWMNESDHGLKIVEFPTETAGIKIPRHHNVAATRLTRRLARAYRPQSFLVSTFELLLFPGYRISNTIPPAITRIARTRTQTTIRNGKQIPATYIRMFKKKNPIKNREATSPRIGSKLSSPVCTRCPATRHTNTNEAKKSKGSQAIVPLETAFQLLRKRTNNPHPARSELQQTEDRIKFDFSSAMIALIRYSSSEPQSNRCKHLT